MEDLHGRNDYVNTPHGNEKLLPEIEVAPVLPMEDPVLPPDIPVLPLGLPVLPLGIGLLHEKWIMVRDEEKGEISRIYVHGMG